MAEDLIGAGGAPAESDQLSGAPTEGTGAEAANGAAEEPELYTVKVGGKEQKVTLREALDGYQRTADYTRKSQALAAKEQELSQHVALVNAIRSNPEGTLRQLAAELGVELSPRQAAKLADGLEDADDPLARMERTVTELTSKLTAREQRDLKAQQEAQEAERIQAQILGEVEHLHEIYGDFPDAELYVYARDGNFSSMAAAYKAWQFDALESQRIAETNAATEAKRKASVVSGGTNPSAPAAKPGANGKMSVRQAMLAAFAEHQ